MEMDSKQEIQWRIRQAAEKVFKERGYERADMRTIAQEANIAVGTIYNYYQNKALLYHDILIGEWETIRTKIERLMIEESSCRERIKQISALLFPFISGHINEWHEIMADVQYHHHGDKGRQAQLLAHQELKDQLNQLFMDGGYSSEQATRLTLTFVGTLTQLGVTYPENVEENTQYMTWLFNHLLTK